MQFRSRAQTGNGRDRQDSTGRESAPTPPSMAWAAAQQAFSPHQQAPADKPVVIVRKGRVLLAGAAALHEAQTMASLPEPVDKPARVFRVAALPVAADPAGEPERAGSDLQVEPRVVADMPRETPRRRIALEKRPGPVLSIVHALPAVEVETPTPDHVALPPLDGVGAVAEMFASVDAILDDIKRARSFRFVDADFTNA